MVQTTFPRLLLEHAARRPDAPALREKEYGIWQTLSWGALATMVRHLACGLPRPGSSAASTSWWWARTGPGSTPRCSRPSRSGPFPCRSTRTRWRPSSSFPSTTPRSPSRWSRTRSRSTSCSRCASNARSSATSGTTTRAGCATTASAGLASLDELIEAGRSFDAAHPGFFEAEVEQARPEDVAAMFFTSGTTGQPKGVVHTHFTLIDRAQAGAVFDKLTEREEVLAYLPPAWIGQNIFSYAQWLACGYVVNCPESAGHGDDRPEGDRPDLLLRAAAHLRGPADQRDDPHGRRRPPEALAVPHLHGRGASRGARPHGRQAPRRRGCAALRPGQPLHLRPAAQHARHVPRARGLHGRRGDRAGPLHLLPLHRHQPQAALRLDRDRGVRLPAARRRGSLRHRGRADRGRGDRGGCERRDPDPLAGPAQGVLQEPGGHRRGQDRRGLVPHRRRGLPRCHRAT